MPFSVVGAVRLFLLSLTVGLLFSKIPFTSLHISLLFLYAPTIPRQDGHLVLSGYSNNTLWGSSPILWEPLALLVLLLHSLAPDCSHFGKFVNLTVHSGVSFMPLGAILCMFALKPHCIQWGLLLGKAGRDNCLHFFTFPVLEVY